MTELATVFLSDSAAHAAQDAFRQAATSPQDIVDALEAGRSRFLGPDDWDDFDELYLFLYRTMLLRKKLGKPLRLTEQNSVGSAARKSRFGLEDTSLGANDQVARVDFMLDIPLTDGDNQLLLPNEFSVHSVLRFRNAFSSVIPYPSRVSDIDTGCVLISFEVLVLDAAKARTPLGVDDPSSVAQELVSRKLSGEYWTRMRELFKVQYQNVTMAERQ